MNWTEFKQKNNIIVAEEFPSDTDGYFIETSDEENYQKEFEKIANELEKLGITEYLIAILVDEDNEYFGCYLDSITINGLTISTTAHSGNGEEGSEYAEIKITKEK